MFEEDINIHNFLKMQDFFKVNRVDEVVFSTVGGDAGCIRPYLKLLNTQKPKLICDFEMHSAGWLIFYEYEGPKGLGEYFTAAGTHMPTNPDISLRDMENPESMDSVVRAAFEGIKNDHILRASTYLNNEELNRYTKGEMVYLNRTRVEEIIDKK